MFYQGLPMDHCTHVPNLGAQPSFESEYNSAWTAGMDLAHFSMLNNDMVNKYPDVVTEQSPLVIFNRKSAVYMVKYGKDTKHTRNISRRMQLVRNGGE